MNRTAAFDERVDDWSDSGKHHPIAQLSGLTEEEIETIDVR